MRPQLRHLTICLLLALAYFITGRLGLMLPAFGSTITLIWLPTGIAVASLLRWGFGCWPGVALGAVAVNFAVGVPLPAALGMAVGNTCGTLLAAWALRRIGFHPAFDRSRDILFLSGAAIFGMVVCATVGVASLSLAGALPGGRLAAWLIWWAGDAIGVIIAAPLVFAINRKDLRAILLHRAEFAGWLGATALLTSGVFVLNRGSDGQAWALAFVPLPMVAWAALRYGPVGTSVALIVIPVIAAYGTATGHGPFYRPHAIEGVMVLWIFMATAAALGWVISALHAARVQAAGVQQLFEQALTDVSLGVLLAGLDRRITYANQGFTRLTGYTEAELLGESCALLQGPETAPGTGEKLKAALRDDGFFDGEILNYRKDGTTFWNALLISPVHDERGHTTGFLGIQRDVTQRKRAELALHQSEEHLRQIIELEPECVKILSPEGTLLEMNPAGLAMIEATSFEQVRGCPLGDLIVPEHRAAFAELHQRAMAGGTGRCEFAIKTLKGTPRWLETHAVPYRDGQRAIIGVLGITRDVTERKEAVAELERSLATLQLFIDTVPAYISFVDADERYVLVNSGYEKYFGRPASQIVGQRLCDAQPPAAYAEMRRHVRAALAGQTVRYQSNPTGPDGKSYWFDVHYVPRHGAGGAVTGFFVLVFDITENKQAELALRESRSRLDGILNCLDEVVYSSTPDGAKMLFISAGAEDLYGHPVANFMADPQHWFETIHPDDRDRVASGVRRLHGTGSFEDEYRIVRPDGTVRWVHDRGAFVPDENGQPLRLDGIVTDITGRKMAADRLRDSEERLRLAMSAAHQGLYDLNVQTGECIVSPEYALMLGYDPAEFHETNAAWRERMHPEDRDLVYQAYLDYVAGLQDEYRVEFRQRTKDGAWKWVLSLGSIVARTADGLPLRMLGTHTDITGRKRAEEERAELVRSLQESQTRLQTLVANLPGMAYRCLNDPQWTMSYVSEGCEAVTGYRRDELENNRSAAYGDLVHPDDRDWLWAKCQKSLDARTPCQNEYRITDRHGRVRWVSERASGVYADDGALLAIDGFIQDITAARQAKIEREQLDRKMQETQKLESLGVLAGGIAHDFNNLLTSVLGNASIAQMELPAGSSVQDCLEQITEASLRAADLCKQMLAYSGRGRFIVQTLDLGQLVEQTTQMLQLSISKKAVLRFRLEKDLPPIEVDATQIRQVIMNLVINASEAIGEKSGVISLSTGLTRVDRAYLAGTLMDSDLPEGEYVFLEASDNGSGMSAETQAKIFDPFFTTKFTGRGLGLAAVLGIVRGHKGALKVYSEVGRGTTFKLLFPAAHGLGEASAATPAAAPAWRGAGNVLVVDDEETMRSTVARMMRLLGLEPVLATDGREAVEIFRADPDRFALVLLDLTMPHMDGEQTFTELRRLRPDVRVVLMSGFNAHEAMVRFTGKGLASFLQKPFSVGDLRAVMQQVLG